MDRSRDAELSNPSLRATALVCVLAALPTLVALFASPQLILDDIQFATIARFEGLGGFVEEMSYRPGQGLIHGLQFTAFGTNAAPHMVLLALANALNAALGLRLLRRWLRPDLAAAIIAVWLLLPDRGSTKFWVSTVPNHVALSLTIAAALVVSRRSMNRPDWLAVTALLTSAVVTYEAIGPLAAVIVLAGTIRHEHWRAPSTLLMPLLASIALAASALFVLTQSPRGGASTMLAAPLEGVGHYFQSLNTAPLGPIGALLIPTALGWAILDRRPQVLEQRKLVGLGLALACAGLSPFIVAGFNIQTVGVLDRSMFFASLGTAMILGAVVHVIIEERRQLPGSTQHLIGAFGVVLGCAGLAATMSDLGPYVGSWQEQQQAASALEGVPPDLLGLVDVTTSPSAVLVDVPLDDGVAWAHYGLQVQDLYQLVNDEADEPLWLGLTWGEPPADTVALTIVDGELQLAETPAQD